MHRFMIPVIVLVSMFAAACGSSSKPAGQASNTTVSRTTAPGASPTTGAAGTVVLNVVHNAKVNQSIVVNASTETVYLYVPDGSSQTSTVPAALQSTWPAVTTVAANPTVAAGLDQSKLKVNAAHQVSYNGHLLYTFKGDLGSGSANGQGLGKVWYVVSPSGTAIT